MRSLTKLSLLALAAVLTAGTTDAAFAARKKHRTVRHDAALSDTEQRQRDFDRSIGLQYDANGVPILIKGYSSVPKGRAASPVAADEERVKDEAREQIRQSKFQGKLQDYPRPYGSGGYVAPVLPSSRDPVPPPMVQPYNPPKINTFSDRVTSCIQSFPLNRGIGNNPRDQQAYVRQCANN